MKSTFVEISRHLVPGLALVTLSLAVGGVGCGTITGVDFDDARARADERDVGDVPSGGRGFGSEADPTDPEPGRTRTPDAPPAPSSTDQPPPPPPDVSCAADARLCGDPARCVKLDDPTACGPSCAPCPVPTNAVGTCIADRCGFECNPGFQKTQGSCLANNTSPTRRVFVTSTLMPRPNGVADADQRCANAAAGRFPGVFKAWIADSVTSPQQRFPRFTGDYVLVDGTVVARGWSGLTSGRLLHAIDKTELGTAATMGSATCGPAAVVWTGTDSSGYVIPNHTCSDWTSSAQAPLVVTGDALQTASWWTHVCSNQSGGGCAGSAAVYCFEQ